MTNLRWGISQRLDFLEQKLFWEGSINRSDIIERFGVSVPQASKDLSTYQDIAPDNLEYDKRAKKYLAREKFRPVILRPDAERFLESNILTKELSDAPQSSVAIANMPRLARRLDPYRLRLIVQAAHSTQILDILYQSMNPERNEPVRRQISPHAFGTDGTRWHVRAYCHRDDMFKDFLISRCLEVSIYGPSPINSSADAHWQRSLDVELIPNPALSPTQREVIGSDYGMEDNVLKVPVRHSFLFYFLRRYRLDLDDLSNDPREAPLVIRNREEFDHALTLLGNS